MTDKKERLFVIMEVELKNKWQDGQHRYVPINAFKHETMYLDESRIIPASRLRYGEARGHTVFIPELGWQENWGSSSHYLILDPEPVEEKKDEWEEWGDDCPLTGINSQDRSDLADWLKRMPRRD